MIAENVSSKETSARYTYTGLRKDSSRPERDAIESIVPADVGVADLFGKSRKGGARASLQPSQYTKGAEKQCSALGCGCDSTKSTIRPEEFPPRE